MPELAETMQRMRMVATTGALSTATLNELTEFAATLCQPGAHTHLNQYEFPQIAETVRINLLRSHIELLQGHVVKLQDHVVELHDHITALDAKNAVLQKWVAALAVAALVAGAAQAVTAILPYVGISPPQPIASAPPPPAPQQLAPTSVAPSKVDQPNPKKTAK